MTSGISFLRGWRLGKTKSEGFKQLFTESILNSAMAEVKVRIPSTISAEEYPPVIPAVIVAHKVAQEPYIINHGGETPFVENKAVQIETPKHRSWVTCIWPRKSLIQKALAEVISTFILVFTGCGSAMVDTKSNGQVTHVGVSLSFGLVITIMIYAVGHISGAHMNPAVTLAFAIGRHFPWKQVPIYIGSQCVGAISASFVLRLLLEPTPQAFTSPAGSNLQSLVLEIIITFILMFVVAAVATDTRACGELAGIAVGSTVALNALMAGPISGASMNPARSLGPAIAASNYDSLWVYIVGPTVGAVTAILAYKLIRLPMEDECCQKPTKSFRR